MSVARPPSMDSLLARPEASEPLGLYGREAVKEELRRAMAAGETEAGALIALARDALAARFAPSLVRAVNATGVLLHTNLGRAPLPEVAREAIARVASGYSTLEYEQALGRRGKRQDHVRRAARELFGAEDAVAVNNNAAAVFLALAALARGRKVLVSRGELVAIGGSFKIPEILEASGVQLREVGTTNRTTEEDYRRALSGDVAMLLTVHPSNYEIRGYASSPAPAEIARVARDAGLPWLHDQGTGCVVPLDDFGVSGEPTVAECLSAGADLVTFSGDKLFSGPQAGLAVGRADLVLRMSEHPIARAVRPDKLTLAALAATLAAWKTGRWRDFPVYRAAAASLDLLEARGERIRSGVGGGIGARTIEVVVSLAVFGGGTSPEKRFPSRALAVSVAGLSPDELAARLRAATPPVVGRVEEGRVLLDLRSVLPEEDPVLERALRELAGAES
ncbi:MAG TPA: L-seryl-tRNA(Sec) selenium transferase [Thermoanaerobaculia bacterium]|nr:L-seryl-tRNA(Sec) selenium transferase [Thermoanaerobaculia bacterium]